jgi:hypothetical protein
LGLLGSFGSDLIPGDGNGVDRSWFYRGDLYRNHVSVQADGTEALYPEARRWRWPRSRRTTRARRCTSSSAAPTPTSARTGRRGRRKGQARYFGQLVPLIEAALAYAANPANGVTEVVVSGHSLGGSMADLFALYYGAEFAALPGVALRVVSLASAGIDPGTLALRPGWDATLVQGASLVTPDWYLSYDHAQDIVRNPGTYDYARHLQTDPQQAPVTFAATNTLREHLHFEGNRLSVEVPLLDQYALSAKLETNFLPQHYASLYEMIGRDMALSLERVAGHGPRPDRGARRSARRAGRGLGDEQRQRLRPARGECVGGAGGRAVGVGAGALGRRPDHGGVAGRPPRRRRGRRRAAGPRAGTTPSWAGRPRHAGGRGRRRPADRRGGDDALAGGAGADVFVFADAFGADRVTDWRDRTDRLDLSDLREENGGLALTMADLLVGYSKSGATIRLDLNGDRKADVIDLDGDGRADAVSILLSGAARGSIDSGDFLF